MSIKAIMKKLNLIFAILLFTLSCAGANAQTSATAAANRAWPAFWREFSTAVKNRDRVALRKMMPDDFFDGGGGSTPDEWLKFIDENAANGSWRDLQRSVAGGAVITTRWGKAKPTRITRDKAYYFEFRSGRKWYFAGVVGD